MSGVRLEWASVTHDYGGAPVLREASLVIPPGESVALLGVNGAGKTTMTRMLMALVRPRGGRVMVGDWDVAGKRPDQVASRIGYSFQHADQQLFARTVRDDVAFGPRRLGRGDARVDDVLVELGLSGVAARHPHDLPAPLRKLVAIAGVLAMETGALVLDEPTGGFDRELRQVVVEAVNRRNGQGVTVLSVSHDLSFVAATARRTVTLNQGMIT